MNTFTEQLPALCSTIFLCLLSCNSFPQKKANTPLPGNPDLTCATYLESFPTFWKSMDGHYKFIPDRPTFYADFVQNTNTCFQGFTTRQLKRFLGKPNLETPEKLTYFVTKACLTNLPECNIQVFSLENGYFKETLLVAHGLGATTVD